LLASSVVRGNMQGGAGKIVLLTRQAGNPWEEQQLVAADGTYRFIELQPGAYTLKLLDTSVVKADLILDGHNELTIDLAAPGWGWELSDGGVSPGFGIVRCRVVDRVDLPVHLWTPGWSGMILRTGSKQEYGRDVCEFAPLGAGVYKVQPEGIDAIAVVQVSGSRVVWVTFKETTEPPKRSVIAGRIKGGAGRTIKLAGAGITRTGVVAADETYNFAELPAGAYSLTVLDPDPPAGSTQTQADIRVDGVNTVRVDLDLVVAGPTTIEHYLLVGSSARAKDDFMAVLQYVSRFQPVVGADEAEARKARHVTILGSTSAISALVEQSLRMAGCQVQRIEGDTAATLGELLAEDRPY
jgi:hypothetical protein